jgi:hypothetical protein
VNLYHCWKLFCSFLICALSFNPQLKALEIREVLKLFSQPLLVLKERASAEHGSFPFRFCVDCFWFVFCLLFNTLLTLQHLKSLYGRPCLYVHALFSVVHSVDSFMPDAWKISHVLITGCLFFLSKCFFLASPSA